MPNPQTIEKVLAKRSTQWLLRQLTRQGRDGRCALDNIFSLYGRDGATLWQRVKYFVPFRIIELFRKKVGATREKVVQRVFGHSPTRRALINTARGVGKYGLLKPQIFSAPLMVVWNFTQACNFTCKHCYQNAHKRLHDELNLDQQKQVVDQLAAMDTVFLAFAGGEPLMSPTFWPLAEYARKRELHLTLATNGSLLTTDVAKRLADLKFGYVEVSLDSTDPKKHDEFRGSPGYWEKAVSGIKNIVATGVKTGLSATITKLNFDELDDLIELAKKLGCHNFYAFNFIPTGRGKEITALDLTPAMREEMLTRLNKHLSDGKIAIMTTASQFGRACLQLAGDSGVVNTGHYGYGPGANTRALAKYIGGCGAGRCYCAVQPNGVVTPCVFMPTLTVGDLRKERLTSIWERSEVMRLLRDRDDRVGHCKICDYKYHCGGCRARSYGYFQDLRKPDPGCIHNLAEWEALCNGGQQWREVAAAGK